MAYAKKTTVGVGRSIEEVERTLKRYGATQFMSGRDDELGMAMIGFKVNGISYKIQMPIPDRSEYETDSRGYTRSDTAIEKDWDQEYRRRWRVIILLIKAKIEVVNIGISTFEKEFMTNILLPGNQTVLDFIAPQLEKCIENNQLPKMLPMLGAE